MNNIWSIQDIWNKEVLADTRAAKTRDYISASDIGGSFLDRYYKMKGIEPTNPYDERTLRIFDAGKAWEQLIVRIFRMAGILHDTQTAIEISANEKHLKVIGFLDCVIGGKPDLDKAKLAITEYVEKFGLKTDDEFIESRALKLIEYIQREYPDGLEPVIGEIKSVNSMAFWAHKNQDETGYFKGYAHHKLQLLTYLLGKPKFEDKEIEVGRLFYVSKDDLCLLETGVFATQDLIDLWNKDVETMTYYFRNDIKPEREPDIIWNEDENKYEVNWKIARSPYLTLITGLKKEDWEYKANQGLLEMTWRKRADNYGLDHSALTAEEVKKAVMAKDRSIKKTTLANAVVV